MLLHAVTWFKTCCYNTFQNENKMNSLVVLSHTLTTRKDNKDKLLVHKLNLAGFYAVLGRQRE